MGLLEEVMRTGAVQTGLLNAPSAPAVGVQQQIIPTMPSDALRDAQHQLARQVERLGWERQEHEATRWTSWGKLFLAALVGGSVVGIAAWLGGIWNGKRAA